MREPVDYPDFLVRFYDVIYRQVRSHVDEGGLEHEAEWSFPMRFFFRYELEHLVRLSDLELEAVYGDYQENPVHKESKDFVVVCRRNV